MARREPWPDDLKAQARALYGSGGQLLASEVTGIPKRTVNAWARAEGWPRPGGQPTDQRPDLRLAPVPDAMQPGAKGQVVALGYGYQRRALLRRLAELATKALDRAETELDAGHTIKARDATVVVGIALDKAELLARANGPDAIGHPEVGEVVGRMRELAHDLRARRVAGNGQPG